MSQLEILPFYNQGLFSNNYLEHHLPQTTIWSKSEDQIKYARKEISLAYKNIKGLNLGPGEEASLEDKLIRPVLKILGYELDIQPTTQRGAKRRGRTTPCSVTQPPLKRRTGTRIILHVFSVTPLPFLRPNTGEDALTTLIQKTSLILAILQPRP